LFAVPRRNYQLLGSIPSVSKILASTIALETGAIERWASRLVFTLRQCRTDRQLQNQRSGQQTQREQTAGLGFDGGGLWATPFS
jgi:hypothetical protein